MLSFINEVTAVEMPEVLKEFREGKSYKVKFRACLQTVDEVNSNKRLYRKEDLVEALSNVSDKIKKRMFLGELDHPIEDDQKRQVVVLLKNASHLVTRIDVDGREVIGICETLTTPSGQILTSLIKDKVPIGFSLRALGNVEFKDGVSVVKKPIFIITYDAVSNPSHREAIVREVVTEGLVCIDGLCFNTTTTPLDDLFEYCLEKLYRDSVVR